MEGFRATQIHQEDSPDTQGGSSELTDSLMFHGFYSKDILTQAQRLTLDQGRSRVGKEVSNPFRLDPYHQWGSHGLRV